MNTLNILNTAVAMSSVLGKAIYFTNTAGGCKTTSL